MKTLKILLFAFFPVLSYAQHDLYQDAIRAYEDGDFRGALDAFESASESFYEVQSLGDYVTCNLKMAQCHLTMGDARGCRVIAESAVEFIQEELPTQQVLLAEALALSGTAELNLGRTELAIELLLKASKLFSEDNLKSAECYENLGIAYNTNNNKELALQYHERALGIRQSTEKQNAILIADSYINLGGLYLLSEPLLSLPYFRKALANYQQNLKSNHPKVAYAYSNLAYAEAEMGNFDKAIEHLDKVDAIWSEQFSEDHPNKAYALSSRGQILKKKGDLEAALMNEQEALKMYLRIHGDKHPEVANAYFLIGQVYLAKGDFLSAVESQQNSIYANLIGQQPVSVYDLPELKNYFNADILLSSLQAKAKSMEALHFERTLKLRDIDGAVRTYIQCDELISQIRQMRLSEADKLKLGMEAKKVYENGIGLSLFLSERTFKKKEYLELAFNFCERSKSAILLEAINETNAKSFAGIPAKVLAVEDSLKNEISYLELKLTQVFGDELEKTKNDLFDYQASLRNFIAELESDYPSYFQLKYNQDLASSDELIQHLPNASALITYFTGNEKIYVFTVSGKGIEAISFDLDKQFDRKVRGLRNAIKYHLDDEMTRAASDMYQQLIPRLSTSITDLVIVPDGVLGTLPFEVLINDKSRFLIEDYKISYDYSATLLYQRLALKSHSETSGILLAAPIDFGWSREPLTSLPDSENEIKEIKILFMGDERQVAMASGKEANEGLLKSDEIGKYRYLHFATHGQVNESEPALSRIFLSPSDHEDGSLYSGEIYNLKLNADLVTLSACETGLGKIAKGEGIVGLSRALMFAGAENIVVSLWPVADQSTAQLMIDFYKQHLYHSDNNLFSDDLRKAKLAMIASENYKHPFYWAPFILVGL